MIGEALCVQKGEVRLGKGGVPGNCGNGYNGREVPKLSWNLISYRD